MLKPLIINLLQAIAKIAIFLAIVGIGIIFLPQDIITNLDRQIKNSAVALQESVEKRMPELSKSFSEEWKELKADLTEVSDKGRKSLENFFLKEIENRLNEQ